MKTKSVTLGKEYKVGSYITCIGCGKLKRVKPCHVKKAKYCSYECYWEHKHNAPWNKGMKGFMSGEKHWCYGKNREDVTGENNWKWNGGIKTYRKYVSDKLENGVCEICNKKIKLLVHHKDTNRHNNRLENLQVICFSCHCNIHKHFNRWGEYAY